MPHQRLVKQCYVPFASLRVTFLPVRHALRTGQALHLATLAVQMRAPSSMSAWFISQARFPFPGRISNAVAQTFLASLSLPDLG